MEILVGKDDDTYDLAQNFAEKYNLKQEKLFDIIEKIEKIKTAFNNNSKKQKISKNIEKNALKINIDIGNNKNSILVLKEGENLKK